MLSCLLHSRATAVNRGFYSENNIMYNRQSTSFALLAAHKSLKLLLTASYPPLPSVQASRRVLRFSSGLIEIYNQPALIHRKAATVLRSSFPRQICYYHYYIILINFGFASASNCFTLEIHHFRLARSDYWCSDKKFMTHKLIRFAKFADNWSDGNMRANVDELGRFSGDSATPGPMQSA